MGILLAAIWFVIVLYIDVKTDYKRLQTNTINHKRGFILRSLGLLPSFFCLLLPVNEHIILKSLTIIGLLGSFYWELFDGFFNLKRGYKWRFNGSDDKDDAVSDNILQKISPLEQAFLKIGLIISFTFLYCLI